MSEFRIFCLGGFIFSGLVAAVLNRVGGPPESGSVEAILSLILCLMIGGCASVAFFGGRRQA